MTHKNQLIDPAKAKKIGIKKYDEEQVQKKAILTRLLDEFDNEDDVFFCLAVNLLELDDLNSIIDLLDSDRVMEADDKLKFIKNELLSVASKNGVVLKLRKRHDSWFD